MYHKRQGDFFSFSFFESGKKRLCAQSESLTLDHHCGGIQLQSFDLEADFELGGQPNKKAFQCFSGCLGGRVCLEGMGCLPRGCVSA